MNSQITSSFFGKCYGCKKMREIVSCVSWTTQNGSDGKKVTDGYFSEYNGRISLVLGKFSTIKEINIKDNEYAKEN